MIGLRNMLAFRIRLLHLAIMAASAVRADASPAAALTPGQRTTGEISRGEVHRYYIQVAADTCLPIRLRQMDIDVWMTAQLPSGERVLDLNWEEWGEERYHLCSTGVTRFDIEVRASTEDTHRGTFTLIVGRPQLRSRGNPDLMDLQRAVASAIRGKMESEPLEKALAGYRKLGDSWPEMKVESHLARAYHRKGVFAQAIQHQRAALALARRLPDRTEEAISLRELYRAYGHVGERQRRETARQAYIGLMTASPDGRIQAAAWEAKARFLAVEGQFQSAIAFGRRAASFYQATGKRDAQRDLLSKLVEFHLNLKEFDNAREAANAYLEAQKATGLARNQASGYTALAGVAAAAGNHAECAAHCQTAAAIHRMTGEMLAESEKHDCVRAAAYARGNFQEALRRIDWAIRLREKAGQSVGSAKWQAGMEENPFRRIKAEILLTMHRQDPTAGYAEQALLTADSMRAGYVARRDSRLGGLQSLLTGNEVLVEYLVTASRSVAWVLDGKSLQLHELAGIEELAPLVENYRSSLVARNRRDPNESVARRTARIQEADKRLEALGTRLSNLLLAPLTALLGERKLLIVPDGPLEHVPFAALRDPVDPGGRPMGHVREIAFLPSAGAILALRESRERVTPPTRGLAVVADPVFRQDDPRLSGRQTRIQIPEGLAEATRALGLKTIPRLLYSRVEGNSIAKFAPDTTLLLDFEATREAFLQGRLRDYRILHFAAHGISNLSDPNLSGLVLSLVDRGGQPQNGFLRFEDVYRQRLNAELVVLSACQTAVGKRFDETGMMTMAGAFLHTGAERVVSTLWKIDDEATAEFMKSFYRELLSKRDSPTAALRAAQRELANSPRWRSPYYWGAFILQGWPH